MFALQIAMAALPNIHPIAPIVIATAVVFGWKTLYSVGVFILLEGVIYGFGMWWLSYLYVWPLLVLVVWALRRWSHPLLWAVVAGAFGLFFGTLCSIPYFLTGGIGADVVIVTAGGHVPLNSALNSVRTCGQVALIAESNAATIDPSNQFLRKLVELKGCWYFNRSDWEEIANFIVDRRIPLNKISSHTYPISEAATAFPLFDSGATQTVVFTWDD